MKCSRKLEFPILIHTFDIYLLNIPINKINFEIEKQLIVDMVNYIKKDFTAYKQTRIMNKY